MIARLFFLSILLAYCKSAPAGNPCVDGTGGISADPNDGSKFLKCHLDVAFSQSCPPGLVFNAASNICDWPSNAGGAAPIPATTVSNSHGEFSNLNFESQTFQPVTTTTQFTTLPTSGQLSEFSNLNFGVVTTQSAVTSFLPVDLVTFASATESPITIATTMFNFASTTQSSEFSNFNFAQEKFQTAPIETQFTTASPFVVVTEPNSQFFTETTTTKKNNEKVFMSFKPTTQSDFLQSETSTSFNQFNVLSTTNVVPTVVEQQSFTNRPKQTVVNNFLFEEIDKNHKIDRNEEKSFVQATKISNIALVPTIALPTKTKDDRKVKISVSDLSSLFQGQSKTSTIINTHQVVPEQITKTSTTHAKDYDYDYEEQIMTTKRSKIRPHHSTVSTTTHVISTVPTTTPLSLTTVVNNLVFENILRNPNNQNDHIVTTHGQQIAFNQENIARIGAAEGNQEQNGKTTTLSDYYYDYEEETTTPITTTTRRIKHLKKRPHKTTTSTQIITTTTTTTSTTTSTTTPRTTTLAPTTTRTSVTFFDEDFDGFEVSSSTLPSFDFMNDEVDVQNRIPLRKKLRMQTTTMTTTPSHSENNMFSLEFDEPAKVRRPEIDFSPNSDHLKTSTNFASFDIDQSRGDFSKNSLRTNRFKQKLLEKLNTETLIIPTTTPQKIMSETKSVEFDFPSFDNVKQVTSNNMPNEMLTKGPEASKKISNSNLVSFDEFEDDSIDQENHSGKLTTTVPSTESINFNFSNNDENANKPTVTKTNSMPNFEIVEIKTTTRFSQPIQFQTQAPKVEKFGSFNFEPIPRHN